MSSMMMASGLTAPAMTASLTPTSTTWTPIDLGFGEYIHISTSSSTATPSGGTAPYAYAWEQVSGDDSPWPNNPTSATTDFNQVSASIAVMRCKVTDSLSVVAYTNNFTIG